MDVQCAAIDYVEFNKLPDIDNINPLDSSDLDCIIEVRDVIERHGMLSRFGIGLLHKHFDLNEGETLVEITDCENRCPTIQPVAKADLVKHATIPTLFTLVTGDAVMTCHVSCIFTDGRHRRGHYQGA